MIMKLKALNYDTTDEDDDDGSYDNFDYYIWDDDESYYDEYRPKYKTNLAELQQRIQRGKKPNCTACHSCFVTFQVIAVLGHLCMMATQIIPIILYDMIYLQ